MAPVIPPSLAHATPMTVPASGGLPRAGPSRLCRWLLPLGLVAGCQSYRPLPLTEAVPPVSLADAAKTLRQQAVGLHNPLLHAGRVDPSDGYTPEELAVAAVVFNPTVRAARDRARLTDAQARQAAVLPNPALAFSLDVPVGANTAGNVAGYGLSVEWEITALLAHGAKVAAATQAAAQGRLDTAWQEWQIAQAARQAAYDVLALRQQLAGARALARQLDRRADAAGRALAKHDLTTGDASAVVAAAGEAHTSVATAERELADAELALRRAIGVAPDEPLPLDARVALPTHVDVPDAPALAEHLAEHRIDLVALRHGYASQEAAVRASILGQFPKISLGVSHTRDTGDFLTLGPALTIELPVFDRNQGVIAVEQATRRQLFDEYHARLFEAGSDIARAVAAVRAIDAQIAVVAGQVGTLQTLVDADDRALRGGELDAATFFTAAASLAQRQTDLAKLQQELVRGVITLELAAGVSLPMRTE